MEPVIANSLFRSISMLVNGFKVLADKCVDGITANKEHCRQMVLNSIGIVTALNPIIGYENSAAVAREALATNRSVYDIVLEKKLMDKTLLDEVLSTENLLHPRFIKEK